MNNEDFNLIVDDCIDKMRAMLQRKTGEYVRKNERFHNFKVAGRRRDITPERALAGMKEKHCVSIEDIIDDLDNGILPTMAMLDEKFGDEINYLVLLKGLIIERIREKDKIQKDIDDTGVEDMLEDAANCFESNIPSAIKNLAEFNKNTKVCDSGTLYCGVGLSEEEAKRISNSLKYKFGKKRSLVTLPGTIKSIQPKKSTKKKVGKK